MASGHVSRIQKAEHMAAPINAAKREESSCQLGAVHTWQKAAPSDVRSHVGNCEGFRMTAARDDSAGTEAVVRKPPRKEPAGSEARLLPARYGDLIGAMTAAGQLGVPVR
jgi:hypothetical protein